MATVYEIINETIIKRLEDAINGGEEFQWVRPWNGVMSPRNFVSKEPYKGINLLLLPYGGYYMTMKQVNSLGGKIMKGSKSCIVAYWGVLNKDDKRNGAGDDCASKDSSNKKKSCYLKYYRVFHQSQIEGIDFGEEVLLESNMNSKDLISDIETFVETYSNSQCSIKSVSSNSAYYSPSFDEIVVPKITQYKSVEEYYSTLFHEIVHSTGHPTRLDRFEKGSSDFGGEEYSKEELVAEIGSCMLRGKYSILDNTSNSIAYLKGWLQRIKNGSISDVVHAAQQAQKAVDFLNNIVVGELNENTQEAI